ncbi:MAG: SOS response-associated peptidase, partial [Hyphococcus sp.]
ALMRWGFIPSWARKAEGRPLINARAETAADKPTFRSAFRRRRCLIPADGFYEWRAGADGKTPYAIARRDGGLFAFAGVWETACDPDGGEVDTAAILTTAAGPDLRRLHHREPVVIAPADFALWLEADERDLAQLAPLLNAAPQDTWRFHEVSKAVNRPRHDGPDLLAPAGHAACSPSSSSKAASSSAPRQPSLFA